MIFSLMAFIVMVLLTGIAIDVLRQETSRIKLQNTLDRAILAAANLDQELDPELVVRDYFEKAGMTRFLGKITVESDAKRSYRTVTANATASVPTMFMHWKGVDIDHLDAVAGGRAEERITNVEISLILDISGSMGGTKIATLRTAGQDFVDEVLKDTSVDRVSISLIPYTAQVNAGPEILSLMNLTSTPRHNFSHCIEFTPADFTRAGLRLPPATAAGTTTKDNISIEPTMSMRAPQVMNIQSAESATRPVRVNLMNGSPISLNINLRAAYALSDMVTRKNTDVDMDYLNGLNDVYDFLVRAPHPTWIRVSAISWNAEEDRFTVVWSKATKGHIGWTTDTLDVAHRDDLPILADGAHAIIVEASTFYTPVFSSARFGMFMDQVDFDNFIVTSLRTVPAVCWDGIPCYDFTTN